MNIKRIVLLLLCASILGCKKEGLKFSKYEKLKTYQKGEELLVGKFSVDASAKNAFIQPLPGLNKSEELDYFLGRRLFKTNWIPAPASTTGLDGLGPTFNSKSCIKCHIRMGRGQPIEKSKAESLGFLMRLSIPGSALNGGPNPVPGYGTQLQNRGVLHVKGEANVKAIYKTIAKKYPDGTLYELRKPIYSFTDASYGVLPSNLLTSPRVGQQTIGLGFVDALSEEELLKNADEFDKNKDGISGKANYVWNIKAKKATIGKFGWKANAPNLKQQVAVAFHQDIGISTPLFPKQNCPSPQKDCQEVPNGDGNGTGRGFEVPEEKLKEITFFQASLAVPKRRNVKDAAVLKGKSLFHKINCIACHASGLKVEKSKILPQINGTIINPYSDFLLHDMGEELADNRSDFLATGREWRTQPLWGVGLIAKVNKHTFLMHDGRARNIEEAILWHGGEAEKSKQDFMNLTKKEREQVLKFINSL